VGRCASLTGEPPEKPRTRFAGPLRRYCMALCGAARGDAGAGGQAVGRRDGWMERKAHHLNEVWESKDASLPAAARISVAPRSLCYPEAPAAQKPPLPGRVSRRYSKGVPMSEGPGVCPLQGDAVGPVPGVDARRRSLQSPRGSARDSRSPYNK